MYLGAPNLEQQIGEYDSHGLGRVLQGIPELKQHERTRLKGCAQERTSWIERRLHNAMLQGLRYAAREHFDNTCLTLDTCAALHRYCRKCGLKGGCFREFTRKGTARIAARKLEACG